MTIGNIAAKPPSYQHQSVIDLAVIQRRVLIQIFENDTCSSRQRLFQPHSNKTVEALKISNLGGWVQAEKLESHVSLFQLSHQMQMLESTLS